MKAVRAQRLQEPYVKAERAPRLQEPYVKAVRAPRLQELQKAVGARNWRTARARAVRL